MTANRTTQVGSQREFGIRPMITCIPSEGSEPHRVNLQ